MRTSIRWTVLLISAAALAAALTPATVVSATPRAVVPAVAPAAAKLKLLWAEEFNGKRGLPPTVHVTGLRDRSTFNWNTEVTSRPNNRERQYYTDGVVQFNKNGSIAHWAIELDGKGSLVINAIRPQKAVKGTHRGTVPPDTCYYGPCEYLSGRMNTKDRLSFLYGQIQARMKIPQGEGTWPAFWMLGANIDDVNWPSCGELDIMEAAGTPERAGSIFGSMHSFPSDGFGLTSSEYPEDLYTKYHIFGIRWVKDRFDWMLDGKVFFSMTRREATADYNAVWSDVLGETLNREWPFNKKMFLILNLAMGGTLGGDSDNDFAAPAGATGGQLMVDWIRYYSVNGQGRLIRE